MLPTALLSCPGTLLPKHLSELAKLVHLIPTSCNLKHDEIQDTFNGASIWIIGGNEYVTLEALKNSSVRFVIYIGEQFETALEPGVKELCDAAGMKIIATGGGRKAVALSVIEEMVAHMRREQSRMQKHYLPAPGVWELLQNKKIVIIGAGGIGSMVLDMLHENHGCQNLFYTGGRGPKDELSKKGYQYIPNFEKGLELETDILSLHLTFIPGVTERIVGLNQLTHLLPNGLYLNYARAWETDPPGLHEFLTSRKDARVIFDQFYLDDTDALKALQYARPQELKTIRAILRQKNFESRGHTATRRKEASLQYGTNLLQLIREILQELN